MKNNLKLLKTIPKLSKRIKIFNLVKSNIKNFNSLTFTNKLRITKYYALSLISIIGNTLYTIFGNIIANKYAKFLFIPLLITARFLFVYRTFRLIAFFILAMQYICFKNDFNFIVEAIVLITSID